MNERILAVDDSFSVRKLLEYALKARGYEVITAADGQEALEKLTAGAFDLVILDINMPRMDGFTFLRKVKLDLKKRDLPVLMLTTEGQPEDKDRAIGLGATAYVVKPFKPTELVEAAEKVLNRSRSTAEAGS